MATRALDIIQRLDLQPHPEGGRYRRVFESQRKVSRAGTAEERLALTSIIYLLRAGEQSDWHRVASDEAWHFYEGAELALTSALPDGSGAEVLRLGPLHDGVRPVHVIPAGHWQRARSLGDYTLVGCSVGPGFDFADFTLARDLGPEQDDIRRRLETL